MDLLVLRRAVSSSQNHTLFLDSEHQVWSAGNNSAHQLGYASNESIVNEFKKIEEISHGAMVAASKSYNSKYSMVVDQQGSIWAFGDNTNHQLSTKGTILRNNSLLKQINLRTAIQWISCGYRHSVAIDIDGFAWGTGDNSSGQMGGTIENWSTFKKIKDISNLASVECAFHTSLFLNSNGEVWCLGKNTEGQLGLGIKDVTITVPTKIPDIPHIISVSAFDDHMMLLDINGDVWGAGANQDGRLGVGDFDNRFQCIQIGSHIGKFRAASVGGWHSSLITTNGEVYMCGYNGNGQLGISGFEARTKLCRLPDIPAMQSVVCGMYQTWLLDEENQLYFLGDNENGQSGSGTLHKHQTPYLHPNLHIYISNRRFKQTKRAVS